MDHMSSGGVECYLRLLATEMTRKYGQTTIAAEVTVSLAHQHSADCVMESPNVCKLRETTCEKALSIRKFARQVAQHPSGLQPTS